MSEQYDEHEQSERVRQWLAKNGSNLLTAFLLVIAGVGGWQWWQGKQANQSQEAGSQYQKFTQAADKPDAAKAVILGEAVIKNYAKSDFAFLAALRLSKLQMDQGKPDLAMAALEKAEAVAGNEQNIELAKIRKVQLLLAQAKYVEAQKAADAIKSVYYPASLMEAKADIAMANGKRDQASTLYRDVLLTLDPDSSSRAMIEMKLSDAGGTVETTQEIR